MTKKYIDNQTEKSLGFERMYPASSMESSYDFNVILDREGVVNGLIDTIKVPIALYLKLVKLSQSILCLKLTKHLMLDRLMKRLMLHIYPLFFRLWVLWYFSSALSASQNHRHKVRYQWG